MELNLMKYAHLILLLLCLSSFAETAKRPNIVIIFTDDMGYGDVSCYDHDKHVHTPNIDKIASAGVKFTNGYVSSAQCED